uniref:Voltage-dependent calcium channel gamma-7 subunit n=1 Tax=Felis catus TaxID=9685 RepID=A0ABI7YHG7_FELCA
MSHCSSRALTLLSSVFGACGLLLVGIAVSTDYWLYMEEGTVLPQNQTTEVKMALHAGLWRVCFFAGREKGRCVASEYFLEPEINLVTENTENILKTVRTATPFPMVSLFLVFTAFVISNIGHIRPQRTILAFVSGIFFILSALRGGGDVPSAPGLLPPATQRLLGLLRPVSAARGVAPRPQPLRHLQRRLHPDDSELPSSHQVPGPPAHLHLAVLRPAPRSPPLLLSLLLLFLLLLLRGLQPHSSAPSLRASGCVPEDCVHATAASASRWPRPAALAPPTCQGLLPLSVPSTGRRPRLLSLGPAPFLGPRPAPPVSSPPVSLPCAPSAQGPRCPAPTHPEPRNLPPPRRRGAGLESRFGSRLECQPFSSPLGPRLLSSPAHSHLPTFPVLGCGGRPSCCAGGCGVERGAGRRGVVNLAFPPTPPPHSSPLP